MREHLSDIERDTPKRRLEYGAVPLDPWNAIDPQEPLPYGTVSFRRISEKLLQATLAARERDWMGPRLMIDLHNFLEVSLYDSHSRRIEMNAVPLDDAVDMNDRRVIAAKNGLAVPADLLGVACDYPKIGSTELAKLSHPLDFQATEAMDRAVYEALSVRIDGEFLTEAPHYKAKRFEIDESGKGMLAAIILRKQPIMNITTPRGIVQVVQRKGLLVRGDEEARRDNDMYLDFLVGDPLGFDDLTDKIESHITTLTPEELTQEDPKWLQPVATSYYAKWLKNKPEQRLREV